MGKQIVCEEVLPCDDLHTAVPLDDTFIDRHISAFFVINNEIVLKNETDIRIERDEGSTKKMDDVLILPFAGQARNKLGCVQPADKFKQHPGQQTKALVHSNHGGNLIMEPAREFMTKYGATASDGSMQ